MSKLCFLFRNSYETEDEFKTLKNMCPNKVFEQRSAIPEDSLVIGRFSVLPFYVELEKDLAISNSKLINTYSQHRYAADMENWYRDLKDHTPHTWFTLQEYISDGYNGPVILKGETNSKRELWRTHMFANNQKEAISVYMRLLDDSLIKQQKICIRKFEKLVKYCDDIMGMPIVKEFRFFVLTRKIVAGGFYWSNYEEESGNPLANEVPIEFLNTIIKKIKNQCNFYTLDVAQKEDGSWIVIELNDGCMSGTNSIDPKDLYAAIRKQYDYSSL